MFQMFMFLYAFLLLELTL